MKVFLIILFGFPLFRFCCQSQSPDAPWHAYFFPYSNSRELLVDGFSGQIEVSFFRNLNGKIKNDGMGEKIWMNNGKIEKDIYYEKNNLKKIKQLEIIYSYQNNIPDSVFRISSSVVESSKVLVDSAGRIICDGEYSRSNLNLNLSCEGNVYEYDQVGRLTFIRLGWEDSKSNVKILYDSIGRWAKAETYLCKSGFLNELDSAPEVLIDSICFDEKKRIESHFFCSNRNPSVFRQQKFEYCPDGRVKIINWYFNYFDGAESEFLGYSRIKYIDK